MPLSKRVNRDVHKLPIETKIVKSLGGWSIVASRDTGVMVESARTREEARATASKMRGSNVAKD